ncbi:hypothetical protein GEMRC1_011637 [Eukaryota sp. GEM-RC1]
MPRPHQVTEDQREASISYRMGLKLFKGNDYSNAVTCLSRSISLVPSCSRYFFARGHCWRMMDDLLSLSRHEEAIVDFKQALVLNQHSFKSHFNLSNSYFLLSRYEEAASHLKKASAIESSSPSAHNNLGLCNLHIGSFHDAITSFSLAVKLSPKSTSFLNNRALAYYAIGDYTASLEDLTQALSLDPNDSQLYFNRGNTHRSAGHVELALSDLTTASQMKPSDGLIVYAIGLVHRLKNQEEVAVKKFLRSLELEPHYPPIYHQLGLVYLCQCRYVAAAEAFGKAISLAPDVKEYRVCRAKAAYELCDWTVVIANITSAIEILPATPLDLLLRGTAYFRRNLLTESLSDLELASSLIHQSQSQSDQNYETATFASDPSSACCISPYLSYTTLPTTHHSLDFSKSVSCSGHESLKHSAFQKKNSLAEKDAKLGDLILTALARTERALGNYDSAITHLSAALNSHELESDILFARAQCYFDLGRFADSINDISASIDIVKTPVLYYWRGRYRKSLHDYEGAASDFEVTLDLQDHPELITDEEGNNLGLNLVTETRSLSRGDVCYQLSLVYAHLGKFKEAEKFCGLAISDRKSNDLPIKMSMLHEYAKMSQCTGKHKQAVALFSEVLRSQPENDRGYFRRAFSFKYLKKYKEAALDFEKARKLDPKNPVYVVDYRNIINVDYFELSPPGMESDD